MKIDSRELNGEEKVIIYKTMKEMERIMDILLEKRRLIYKMRIAEILKLLEEQEKNNNINIIKWNSE